jgi:hypothetical protein
MDDAPTLVSGASLSERIRFSAGVRLQRARVRGLPRPRHLQSGGARR